MTSPFINQNRQVAIVHPIETNGGIPVNLQDQTSPLVASYFSQQVSSFTLASDTVASTLDTLSRTFTANTGHGLIVGDTGILLEVSKDRRLEFIVTGVSGDDITIDRPLDDVYAAATTLGRKTLTNMAVNGAITPQIFTIRAGNNPYDFTQIAFSILSSSPMDDGLFGSLTKLTNGLVMRSYDPTTTAQTTLFNIKTNADLKLWITEFEYADKAPSGQYGLHSNTIFAGQGGYGVSIRVSGLQVLQLVVQDDLTGLDEVIAAGKGHQVTN